MRWIWIDRFVEFQSGSHAQAIKNVTLAEDHLHDHFPGFPVMPGSLIIEGLAQTGGILLGESKQFKHIVILAKIPNITFHSWACPGDTLTYTVKLAISREDGGMVECQAHVGGRLVADGEIFFAHLAQTDGPKIDQKNFVFTTWLLGVLDVGRAGDGTGPDGTGPAAGGPASDPGDADSKRP
ncbi:MAG: beta-hydroxyacyl-ACP dehydratase [Planctomycetaceae bacterium]|nr:beta-hydroxyacyl-ACP dehydratase [Planctomycetaceae bacterium]